MRCSALVWSALAATVIAGSPRLTHTYPSGGQRGTEIEIACSGGAFADPRVAEAYRRMLDSIHVREIEMVAAGDGFTETGTEPASIDAVASLPLSLIHI